MIIPRHGIIHCHPQEFCVGAVGDKIIVKAYFKVNCHISRICKVYIVCVIEV